MRPDDAERFGAELMRLVRDPAISQCDSLRLRGVGPDGERWRGLLVSEEAEAALEELAPDIVDIVLFELLNAIDNGDLRLAWVKPDSGLVDLSEAGQGELGGWLMGSPGWRDLYSRQRFFQPFTDLRLDSEE